jgi:hypothetical protein
MFHLVFPNILSKESTEYGEEQHEKLPDIVGPFFTAPMAVGGVGMVVYFQNELFSYLPTKTNFRVSIRFPAISRHKYVPDVSFWDSKFKI